MRFESHSSSHSKLLVRKIPMPITDFILIGIGLLSVLMYAALLVIGSIPPYTLLLLPVLWLVYWIKSSHLSFSTPLDFPLLGLFLIASLGLLISSKLDLFFPKFSGLAIGVSTYYLIVNFLRYRQRLNSAIFVLIFLSLVIILLAIFATDWPLGSIPLLDRVYQRLPSLAESLGGEKINKNTIGGVLSFFPPLLLSFLWDNGAFSRVKAQYSGLSNLSEFVYKALVLFTIALVLFALLLTQSRGAWLGCAVGVLLLCIWKNKRFLWIIPLLLAIFLVIFIKYADGSVTQFISFLDVGRPSTFPGRMEIWQKTMLMLRDFPVTGISLGAFGEVYRQFFSSIIFPLEEDIVYHPHNTLLSVAAEVGIPGLITYTALLGSLGSMSWHVLKTKRSINRVLGIGLSAGLVDFFVFGLLDAFTLGRNLEIIFWIFLGIVTALFVHEEALNSTKASQKAAESERTNKIFEFTVFKRTIKRILFLIVAWIFLVLFSLSLVDISIFAAIISALLLGIAFGIYQTTTYQKPIL